jgi:hypothetical protein
MKTGILCQRLRAEVLKRLHLRKSTISNNRDRLHPDPHASPYPTRYTLFTLSIIGITIRLRSRLTATKGQRNPLWEAMNPPARGPSVMPRDVMEAINP